ncbi:hypothetical protein [Microcoleus sp.]|uniref:hypothetical protein n=1 Tax=Microcoleus sp. TaxID=44472 RepID=UPI003524B3AF
MNLQERCDRPLGCGMRRPIALSDNKGDRPLEFDMRKAIALLVIWEKRAIALSDNKGDRTIDGVSVLH